MAWLRETVERGGRPPATVQNTKGRLRRREQSWSGASVALWLPETLTERLKREALEEMGGMLGRALERKVLLGDDAASKGPL